MKSRLALLLLVLLPALPAAPLGELFWEPGLQRASLRAGASRLMLPWAPVGHSSPPNSQKIAIIDSGVHAGHPQLKGFVLEQADFTGEGLEDVLGHGTLVALIAVFPEPGSKGTGAILSAKVANAKGEIRKEAVMEAIRWAVARGAKIINLSLGFRGNHADYADLDGLIAASKDVLFIAAAGNYGPGVTVYPACGTAPNLISVGATDAQGGILPSSGTGSIAATGVVPVVSESAYWYEQGQQAAQANRLAEARAHYERALQVEPTPEAHFQLGLLDLWQRALDPAIAHFKASVRLNPGLAIVHEHLGTAYFLKEDYPRAERALRESIVLQPEVFRAHFNLGQTYLALERRSEARQAFTEVLRLKPDHAGAREALRLMDAADSRTPPKP